MSISPTTRNGIVVAALLALLGLGAWLGWRYVEGERQRRGLLVSFRPLELDGEPGEEWLVIWDEAQPPGDDAPSSVVEARSDEGEELWAIRLPPAKFEGEAIERVTLCEGTLVVTTGDANSSDELTTVGLDPATGEERWRQEFDRQAMWQPGFLATCLGGLVHVDAVETPDSHHWIALDPRTGEERWHHELDQLRTRPFALGPEHVAVLTRLADYGGVIVDLDGEATRLPAFDYALRDGDRLLLASAEDEGDESPVLLGEIRPEDPSWRPLEPRVRMPGEVPFALSSTHAIALAQRSIVGCPLGPEAGRWEIPLGGEFYRGRIQWLAADTRPYAASAPALAPLGPVATRYLPLAYNLGRIDLHSPHDVWHMILVDIEFGELKWKSPGLRSTALWYGDTWRSEDVYYIRYELDNGDENSADTVWVGFDARLGTSTGVWDLVEEFEEGPPRQVPPWTPGPWQIRDDVVFDHHWSVAMQIELRSGRPQVVETQGGVFRVRDRKAEVEAKLGPLP